MRKSVRVLALAILAIAGALWVARTSMADRWHTDLTSRDCCLDIAHGGGAFREIAFTDMIPT